nr:uncharacterized protein LOC129160606 [Nothobranchius furzeri]
MSPNSELQRHVERLWEVDTSPYVNIKTATRSKEDQQAVDLLEQRTTKVEVDGVTRYATPLLRRKDSPLLWASKNTLLPQLRSTERRLAKDPALADTYCQEIHKLEQLGYAKPLPSATVDSSQESWYLPHHVVHHNGKARKVYKVKATQYDPLGYLIPFTTQAKILIQDLWKVGVDWDEQIQPKALLEIWTQWESELVYLPQVEIPRCYVPATLAPEVPNRQAQIFCDASERAYGAITLWTDSSTVLTWLKSDSSRYKVFVGTRVAEIQELTEGSTWRYVSTSDNPADDLTRGKTPHELSQPNWWSQGPQFLHQPIDTWPELQMEVAQEEDEDALRKTVFCAAATCPSHEVDVTNIDNWDDLVRATDMSLHGAAKDLASPTMTAADVQEAELHLLRQSQSETFQEEVKLLAVGNPISKQSRLLMLAPEYDIAVGLIRVGGRLRRADLDLDTMHPIILDPKHHVTRLLIKKYDNSSCIRSPSVY